MSLFIICVSQRLTHATVVLSPQHSSSRFRHLGAPTAWYTLGAILPGCLCALFRVCHTMFSEPVPYIFRVFLTQFIRHWRAINYDNSICCVFYTILRSHISLSATAAWPPHSEWISFAIIISAHTFCVNVFGRSYTLKPWLVADLSSMGLRRFRKNKNEISCACA